MSEANMQYGVLLNLPLEVFRNAFLKYSLSLKFMEGGFFFKFPLDKSGIALLYFLLS